MTGPPIVLTHLTLTGRGARIVFEAFKMADYFTHGLPSTIDLSDAVNLEMTNAEAVRITEALADALSAAGDRKKEKVNVEI